VRNSKTPLVSVGMPVFNSSTKIHQAIRSILNQDYKNFELIISDNNSTDSTMDICLYYASLDSRIRYFKQEISISPTENFNFVLKHSNGEFFVWAADDDRKSRNFLSSNLYSLNNNPKAVASMSPIFFEKKGVLSPLINVGPFTEQVVQRYRNFFKIAHKSHGMFYSLIRKDCIKDCELVPELFFGWDWAIVLYLLNQGEIVVASEGYTIFGTSGISNSPEVYKIHGLVGLKRAMPFLGFSFKVLNLSSGLDIKQKIVITALLAHLNFTTALKELRSIRYFLGNKKKYVLSLFCR
jgi:glycosyltransferase involved in cell wall biosynthesis